MTLQGGGGYYRDTTWGVITVIQQGYVTTVTLKGGHLNVTTGVVTTVTLEGESPQ